jgi:hypothetical protein
MALKNKETEGAELPKPPTETPGAKPETNGARPRRSNEEVERRLNPYIDANKETFARYTKLVKEDPDHAVRTLMLKDMQVHEGEMRFVAKQMPAAKEWYDKQTLEVKKAIDKRIAEVHPYNRDQAFVQAVVRERNWQNRLPLAPTARPAMAGARP